MPISPSRSESSALASPERADRLPVASVQRELRDGGVELDLGGHVADLLGERERLARRRPPAAGVVAVGALEVMAERHQREHGLVGVGAACQLDRPLEVLARLHGVADAPEHAAEDPVRAARRTHLAEPLGEPQRLLGGVDREHVVAGLHVQPRRLLVEAHERQRRLAVLDQVDAALVVLDRLLALALVRQRGADLAVQLGHALEVLAAAVVVERPLPDVDRDVHAAEPQRDVALLLEDPRDRLLVVAGLLERAPRSWRDASAFE